MSEEPVVIETLPASMFLIISSSLPSYESLRVFGVEIKRGIRVVAHIELELVSDRRIDVCLYLLVKVKKKVLRLDFRERAGLSVLLLLTPIEICMEPDVVRRTPPGPNTFSKGPRAKFISKMLKACFSFFSNISEFFSWK